MTEKKKRINPKRRKLEEVYQNLYQAEANGDKFQIKIWQDIIKKLESDNANDNNKN